MSYCELAGVAERCGRASLFTHRQILNGRGCHMLPEAKLTVKAGGEEQEGEEDGRSKGWEKRDFVHSAPKTL